MHQKHPPANVAVLIMLGKSIVEYLGEYNKLNFNIALWSVDMSLVEHSRAVLFHRDFELHPKYPYGVSKLNIAYNRSRADAKKLLTFRKFPGLIEVIYPGSFGLLDGYVWRYIMWYSVEEEFDDKFGSVYVAFPYLNDREKRDTVSLDRSIALYLWGEVSQKTINRILNNLMYAFSKV